MTSQDTPNDLSEHEEREQEDRRQEGQEKQPKPPWPASPWPRRSGLTKHEQEMRFPVDE